MEEIKKVAPVTETTVGVKRTVDEVIADQSELPPEDATKRQASASEQGTNGQEESTESISIKISFGRQQINVVRPLSTTIFSLKQEIEKETGVPPPNQKLLFKGQLKDEQTLKETGLKNGSKLMVIGTKPEDTKVAQATTTSTAPSEWDSKTKEEPWSTQPQHKKIIDKGRPDDGWTGIAGRQIPLRDDQTYIPGLLSSHGTKVRLTFRPELQQFWIGSAAHTQKLHYGSISKIEAQPIDGNPAYSILKMQLEGSSNSNYWLYWVPSQAVSGIKLRILGLASLLE